MILRPYQTECVDAVCKQLGNGVASTLVVMPTGCGKTQCFLTVADRWLQQQPDKKVLVVAHREELIFQPAERWHQFTGAYPMIEMGEFKTGGWLQHEIFGGQIDDRIIISTTQTLNSGRRCKDCTETCGQCDNGRIEEQCQECDGDGCQDCRNKGFFRVKCKRCQGDGWVKVKEDCPFCYKCFVRRLLKFQPDDIGLVIIDEAHHAPADTYKRIVEYFGQSRGLKTLGVTATPDRADEDALGQVFEEVAYEYDLPSAINDGWLVPIDQKFVIIDELNLTNVRTTAGDLNEGDLEREMMIEKVLHNVVTPTVEFACGLEPGTIDGLIRTGALDTLPSLVQAEEPTLIFATSVAHAERMAEILNRYLPGSAVCITGTTPREERRELIKRFQTGQIQFLCSCGVFLEGFDAPATSVVCMARPTKSRALYAQAIGRGTRPRPDTVDSLATASERAHAIAFSKKPRLLVLDFVGNSGRHKLVSTADILSGNYPDDIVEKAVVAARNSPEPIDMRKMLQRIQEEEEEKRRQAQREAARKAYEREQALKKHAAQDRGGIVAGATYKVQSINPFDVFEMAAERESGLYRGKAPTETQMEFLNKALGKYKVDLPKDLDRKGASRLIGEIIRRRNIGLCTYAQAKLLQKFGEDTAVGFKEASAIIDQIKKKGWKPRSKR